MGNSLRYSPNDLVDADRKNIIRGTYALLGIGIILLVIGTFMNSDVFEYFIAIPIIYIISGIIGIYAIHSETRCNLNIYKIVLCFLIILNGIAGILGLLAFFFLITQSVDCDPKKEDKCGFVEGIYYLITFISLIIAIFSTSLLILISAFLKSVRKYDEDRNLYELRQI